MTTAWHSHVPQQMCSSLNYYVLTDRIIKSQKNKPYFLLHIDFSYEKAHLLLCGAGKKLFWVMSMSIARIMDATT